MNVRCLDAKLCQTVKVKYYTEQRRCSFLARKGSPEPRRGLSECYGAEVICAEVQTWLMANVYLTLMQHCKRP